MTIANMYGKSFFVRGSSLPVRLAAFWIIANTDMPIPAPRYNRPARIVDGMSFSNNFDNGEFKA